nr:vegetative incompatibility protein het-e-1 [Quercus suber]
MYHWYGRAAKCYAYIYDVREQPRGQFMYVYGKQKNSDGELFYCYGPKEHENKYIVKTFVESEWFDRGWTLQELLAPRAERFEFYDSEWTSLSTKTSSAQDVSRKTGIEVAVLQGGKKELTQCAIAQRMSWASKWKTTRSEDMAYSLLGLFNISMPMLYGEGEEKAFVRLQEAIIATSDDHSIFAWEGVGEHHTGLLATNPKAFGRSGNVRSMNQRRNRQPYSMTNRGLSISLPISAWSTDTVVALINCRRTDNEGMKMAIYLRRLYEDDQYARVVVERRVEESNWKSDLEDRSPHASSVPITWRTLHIYVPQGIDKTVGERYLENILKDRVNGFRLDTDSMGFSSQDGKMFSISGPSKWDPQKQTIELPTGSQRSSQLASLDISQQGRLIKYVKLGFDQHSNPSIILAEEKAFARKEMRLDRLGSVYTESELRDARVSMKSFLDWTADDQEGWNSIVAHESGSMCARGHEVKAGLWALKGDRVEGLDISLLDGPGTRDRKLIPTPGTHIVLQRGKIGELVVWDVKIMNMELRRRFWTKFTTK